MSKKDFKLIAESIWRSGVIKDKNKVRQSAKDEMRRLIAHDLIGSLKNDNPLFDENKFLTACGL
jgi:hypothetical protein